MHSYDTSLPTLCHRVLAGILPPFRRIFSDYGITEQQWRILKILQEQDGLSQNEIAQRGLLPKQSLVGIIDRLEKLDLVVRRQSTTDRRKSAIFLTEKSKNIQSEISPKVEKIHQELEKQLSSQQWSQLRDMLTHLAENSPR